MARTHVVLDSKLWLCGMHTLLLNKGGYRKRVKLADIGENFTFELVVFE